MSQLRLRFGSYIHPTSEAAVAISRESMLNDEGIVWAVREMWTIEGRLEAESQVEMTDKIEKLETAYAQPVSYIALEFANTGNRTAHYANNSNLVTPIQVISPPSYPNSYGAEYSGYRNYMIVVEVVKQTANALNSHIVDWQESIGVSGGYPRDVLVQTINTLPIRQRAANQTPCIVTQVGSAASYSGWPVEPQFLLNIQTEAVLLGNSVDKTTSGAKIGGTSGTVTIYRTDWNYAFALPVRIRLPGRLRPAAIPVSKI